jgi:hypothetical protein
VQNGFAALNNVDFLPNYDDRYLNLFRAVVLVNFMAERIGSEKLSRDDGYLYFLGKDGYVWRTPMKTNTRGRKAKVGSEKVKRDKGYLYFIDKSGYVARAKMNRKGRR